MEIRKAAVTILINNKKSGNASYTTSMVVYGFGAITFKLLVSGLTLFSYKMSDVSISDWSVGVGALTALWVTNKHINNIQINKQKDSEESKSKS